MKTLLLVLLLSVVATAPGWAQSAQRHAPQIEEQPGRSAIFGQHVMPHGADSAKFEAEVESLSVLLHPTQSIRSQIDARFRMMGRLFKLRGIDSSSALQQVVSKIDTTIELALLRDALLRAHFTSTDIQQLHRFLLTPVGKKFLDADESLLRARTSEIAQYVQRLIFSVITPMMQEQAKKKSQESGSATPASSQPQSH